MEANGRIDVHHHIVPPDWAAYLHRNGYFGGQAVPQWSQDRSIEFLDRLEIATAIVSVSRPGVYLSGEPGCARDVQGRK